MQDTDEINTTANTETSASESVSESQANEVEAKESKAEEPQKLFSETEAAKVASLFAFFAAMMLFTFLLVEIFQVVPATMKMFRDLNIVLPAITQVMTSPAIPGLIILLMAGLAVKEKFLNRPMWNLYINGAAILVAYLVRELLTLSLRLPMIPVGEIIS